MKTIFMLMALLGIQFNVSAQSVVANDGAQLTLESEVIQLDTMEVGNYYHYTLQFTNTGNQPLIISNAKGSCGCTVPEWPREPVLPGETKAIKIKFHARTAGPVNKSVFITSNDANNPSITVKVRGTVNVLKPDAGAPVTKPNLAPKAGGQ